MENSIINFSFEGNGVRVITIGGEPWWIGKEVAELLGYKNYYIGIQKNVDEEDRKVVKAVDIPYNSPGESFEIPPRGLTIINESGLYSLVLGSSLPSAKRFKHWVTSEVLPAIRKHGGYLTPEKIEEAILNPDVLIKLATSLKEERAKRLAAEEEKQKLALLNEAQAETIAVMKPKADYYDQILQCKNTMNAEQIAKDYGMSAVAFNKLLYTHKVQFKSDNQWVLYQPYADKGYTRSETFIYNNGYYQSSTVRTKWTQEGRIFLYNFLKKHGILPVCERNQEEKK